jgi:hypothetical protein
LPRGFVRIRQTGFLANACRTARVTLARRLLANPAPSPVTEPALAPSTVDDAPRATWRCPHCGAAMKARQAIGA